MTSRGHPGPSRIIRHAPSLGSGSGAVQLVDASMPMDLAEEKLVAEVERLAGENHKLATAQVLLRRDLICAQEEVQTVKAHIRSIQTESDIQIRVLLEKIAKMEAECKNGVNVKKELEQAHKEAQRLVVARQEAADKIENAKKDLNAVQMEIKQLPDVLNVLDNMKEEHNRLRTSFEYEKEVNMRKVEQLQAMERDFITMGKELERLQTEVSNSEKASEGINAAPQVTAPATSYGSVQYQNPGPSQPVQYQNPGPSQPVPAIQSNGLYYHHHPYGVPPFQMGAFPPIQPQTSVEGIVPAPPSVPPVDEVIPPPPPPDTPFDETIPPPPPYDPPPPSSAI